MNEIGKLLTETRVSNNLDLDQIARETNIAKRYLEALEKDDYEIFPGEPYVIGFLRNYAEYLGLEPEKVIDLYKQIQRQESMVPQEVLLPKKNIFMSKTIIFVMLGLTAAAIIGVLVYFTLTKWYPQIKQMQAEKKQVVEMQNIRKALVYELTESSFENRLFEGDSVNLKKENGLYTIKVKKISSNLIMETNLGDQIINLGQSLKLDLDDDSKTDMEILLEDLDKNKPELGALVSITTGTAIEQDLSSGTDVVASTDGAGLKSGQYKVLFESGSAYPVTLNAAFRGYCLFRHESDKANREERYYQKGEQLIVQANNGFKIWASNGNMVKIRLIAGGKTVDMEVSRPGEVIVKELKWIKDDISKRFKFIVANVD